MSAISSALNGLFTSEASLNKIASTLASPDALSPSATQSDSVDLSLLVVGMMAARNANATDVSLLQTADQMRQSTINLLG